MKEDDTVVNGWTFLVTDADGHPTRPHDGFYHRDTRHLDAYALDADASLETVEVTHPRPGERLIHAFTPLDHGARDLHVRRHQVVDDGVYERVTVSNLSQDAVDETLTLTAGTRFDDVFEVRGHESGRTRDVAVTAGERAATFTYDPDDLEHDWTTTVAATQGTVTDATTAPGRADATVTLSLDLAPREERTFTVAAAPTGEIPAPAGAFDAARDAVEERERAWRRNTTQPAHENWGPVLDESRRNLLELTLDTPNGPVFAAGTPWFDTAFGRDSLIAAYQALPLTTELAKATCRYLAAHQADSRDAFRDAEPGKIMHEIRFGESTIRGESPHSPYYGTIDATALFVVLVHEAWRWTGDDDFARDLWPAVERALDWLDAWGDRDGDGFLEYPAERGDAGLTHQAWKDSGDGIMTPDGDHPDGPLAVAEAQGYYYDALHRAADLAHDVADDPTYAADLTRQADDLKARFDDAFWLPAEEFYAIALDGDNEPVPTVSTNPGHCLWSGIVPEERADAVVDRLLAPDMFTGWGVRTVSAAHDVYHPQSYHLGSVWPHDSSLVALGAARYGRRDAAARIGNGLVDAARARGNDRLPELFAGLDRDATGVPLEYGAACEPQAWAAGAPLACYRAVTGDVAPELRADRHLH